MKWKDLPNGTVYSFDYALGERNYCWVLENPEIHVINVNEYSNEEINGKVECDGFRIEGFLPHEFIR